MVVAWTQSFFILTGDSLNAECRGDNRGFSSQPGRKPGGEAGRPAGRWILAE